MSQKLSPAVTLNREQKEQLRWPLLRSFLRLIRRKPRLLRITA
jgi:hypothetical protein